MSVKIWVITLSEMSTSNFTSKLSSAFRIKKFSWVFTFFSSREEDAEKAQDALNERWFGGEAVAAELSPVTNFREACCRDYEMGECTRGGLRSFDMVQSVL